MIARRYETVVGIFVLASLLALLIMVVIIARQEGLFQEYMEYRAVFRNVSGLKTGAEVRLSGVTVGNVTEIVINPNGYIVVTFRVQKKSSDWIRWDTKASIGYTGLLGDRALDLTTGSMDKPPVPPEGFVASVEPLDIGQLLSTAAPSLGDLQKILSNLVTLTTKMTEPDTEFSKTMDNIYQIINKINEGKGTLGMLINNPDLYKETAQTVAGANKFVTDLNQAIFGTPGKKAAGKEKGLADFHAILKDVGQAVGDFRQAATRLPDLTRKLDSFFTNLEKTGKGLPGLVTQAETTFSDFGKTTRAMQRSWLLRRYVPKSEERTIRLDGEAGKD
jgi:phospholipid/cholesterol/gamma-HCH transport system substrate-binding protein